MAGELTLDPEVLLLRGQRDDLLNVSYAKVRLDITGADKTVVQALEFELYDHNDVKIENSAIRSSEKLIGATMPVWTVKEVPLRVNFVEGRGGHHGDSGLHHLSRHGEAGGREGPTG